MHYHHHYTTAITTTTTPPLSPPPLHHRYHHYHYTTTPPSPLPPLHHHCHHYQHHHHHSTSCNACTQLYMCGKTHHQCKLLWAWPSTSTVQTTTSAREYMFSMVEDKAHQRSYGGSEPASPPLKCTMQQAHVRLKWGIFNGMPLCKLHVLAVLCTHVTCTV